MKKATYEDAYEYFIWWKTDITRAGHSNLEFPDGYLSKIGKDRIIKELDKCHKKSPEDSFEFCLSIKKILKEFEYKHMKVLKNGHYTFEIVENGKIKGTICLYPDDFDWFLRP